MNTVIKVLMFITASLLMLSGCGGSEADASNPLPPDTNDPAIIIDQNNISIYQDTDVGLPPFPQN